MNIKVFASGSGGNCMLLSDRGTHLLIDAGISARRIMQSLRTYSEINIRRNIKNARPSVIFLPIQPTGRYLITGNCIENDL